MSEPTKNPPPMVIPHLDKLIPALVRAKAAIKPVEKSGENKFDRYSYATLEDYVRAISQPLASNGLTITFDVLGVEPLEPRQTSKGGTEFGCRVTMRGTLFHESGQAFSANGMGDAYDRGDKAIYKAQTGARKYLLAAMLNLATTDDPEEDSPQGEPRREERDDRRDPPRERREERREEPREERRESRREEPRERREEPREERRPEPARQERREEREEKPGIPLGSWADLEEADLRAAAVSMADKIVVAEARLGNKGPDGYEPITRAMVLGSASGKAAGKGPDGKPKAKAKSVDDFFQYEVSDPSKHAVMMRWLKATCATLEDMLEVVSKELVRAGKANAPAADEPKDELPF